MVFLLGSFVILKLFRGILVFSWFFYNKITLFPLKVKKKYLTIV
jgi:hypothetical protein